jgi:hypothetical protein
MGACTSLPVHITHNIHAHVCRLGHGWIEVITSHSIWQSTQLLWQQHAQAASAAVALQ